jgi:hypothetical protein
MLRFLAFKLTEPVHRSEFSSTKMRLARAISYVSGLGVFYLRPLSLASKVGQKKHLLMLVAAT